MNYSKPALMTDRLSRQLQIGEENRVTRERNRVAASASSEPDIREKMAARLGLSANASPADILAEVDRRQAASAAKVPATASMSEEDRDYYAMFPDELPGAQVQAGGSAVSDDDAEYYNIFPDERPTAKGA